MNNATNRFLDDVQRAAEDFLEDANRESPLFQSVKAALQDAGVDVRVNTVLDAFEGCILVKKVGYFCPECEKACGYDERVAVGMKCFGCAYFTG